MDALRALTTCSCLRDCAAEHTSVDGVRNAEPRFALEPSRKSYGMRRAVPVSGEWGSIK